MGDNCQNANVESTPLFTVRHITDFKGFQRFKTTTKFE